MSLTNIGAIGAAAVQGLGSLAGGFLGSQGASATNAQSIAAAQSNLAQQENYNTDMFNREVELSNTAYTRAVTDMKNAGLNPILALSYGGAQTPNALGVSPAMPSLTNPGAPLGQGVASASQAGQVYAANKAALAQADKDTSATSVNESTEALNRAAVDRTKQETVNSAKTADLITAQTGAAKAQETSNNARAAYDAAQTVIAGHDATTAFHKSRIAAAEADNAEKYGPGYYGDAAATANRVLQSSPVAPLYRWGSAIVNKVVGDVTGGMRPGLVIDMDRKPSAVTHGGR